MNRRAFGKTALHTALMLSAPGWLPALARAATPAGPGGFPHKPLRAVVPYPAGGVVDVTLRPALDRMSLYFCTTPRENSLIEGVPKDNAGAEADLELRAEGPDVVTLTPYPFRRELLELSVMARRIPKRVYADDADLQKTLAGAKYFALKLKLRARRKTNLAARI